MGIFRWIYNLFKTPDATINWVDERRDIDFDLGHCTLNNIKLGSKLKNLSFLGPGVNVFSGFYDYPNKGFSIAASKDVFDHFSINFVDDSDSPKQYAYYIKYYDADWDLSVSTTPDEIKERMGNPIESTVDEFSTNLVYSRGNIELSFEWETLNDRFLLAFVNVDIR
jgi:hypothetical protein